MSDNSADIYKAFDIYKLKEKGEEGDIITDLPEFKDFCRLNAGVNKGYADGKRNMLKRIDNMLQKFNGRGDNINFSHVKTETMLVELREREEKLYRDALADTKLCLDIKNSLATFKDQEKDKVILREAQHKLVQEKKEFYEQMKKTDSKKEKYFKKAFEAEKAEIKRELAEKEEEIKKYTEKAYALQEKVNDCIDKYRHEFDKLLQGSDSLKHRSYEYTTAKTRIDSKRAALLLEQLDRFANETKIKPDDAADVDIGGIRVGELIDKRRPKERIEIKKMQHYKGTENKDELINEMKREMAEEREREERERERNLREIFDDFDDATPRFKSSDRGPPDLTPVVPFDADDDGDYNETAVTTFNAEVEDNEMPGPSRVRGVGAKYNYLVIESFSKQEKNQLNLKQGKFVKLIMPANEKGFAFGEKKGKFGRRIKGYFPISHVKPAY